MIHELVKLTVAQKKESVYWDFKLEHHQDPASLIHDIICLANTTKHSGSRYLIFGIDPNSFEIIGLQTVNPNRQAQIIDILINAHFANDIIPGIKLHQITVEDVAIDVLEIRESREKPYYLSREYKKKGRKILSAGTIYSRVEDRNTAINGVASGNEIEHMWKTRFNLDLNPKQRVTLYLEDFQKWETLDEHTWFFKPHPEYTLNLGGEGVEASLGHDRWARACINKSVYYYSIELKYHQTVLWRGHTVSIDGGRALVVAPEFKMINRLNQDEIIYYYLKNSIEWKVNIYLSNTVHQGKNNYSKEEGEEYIVVFDDEMELGDYQRYLKNNELPTIDPIKLPNTEYDFVNSTLEYCLKAKKLHFEFKQE
jgi:Divergent AAA domain.